MKKLTNKQKKCKHKWKYVGLVKPWEKVGKRTGNVRTKDLCGISFPLERHICKICNREVVWLMST